MTASKQSQDGTLFHPDSAFPDPPDPRKHRATRYLGALSTELAQSQNSSADTLGIYRNLDQNSQQLETESYRLSTHISAIS